MSPVQLIALADDPRRDKAPSTVSRRERLPRAKVAAGRSRIWMLLALLGLSGGFVAAMINLTGHMNFFYDEWTLVSLFRPSQSTSIFVPVNAQWSTIPILIWKGLFILVGLRDHVPYEGALLVFHVASVILMFALIRRRSGDTVAFAAALILLVLGSAGTDIVWAFQLTLVASVAFGLLAMLLLDGANALPGRIFGGSAALICSLMSGVVGIAFVIAALVELSVDAGRRWLRLALIAPIVAFLVWFFAFDIGTMPESGGAVANLHNSPIGLAYIQSLLSFLASAIESSLAGISGIPGIGAILLPIAAALVAIHWYRQGTIKSWQIGLTAGLLSWFILTGAGRAQNGTTAANDPRSIYVGAAFLLPLLADAALELMRVALWRPALVVSALIALCCNAFQLGYSALDHPISPLVLGGDQSRIFQTQNIELQTAALFRGAPEMDVQRPIDQELMPHLSAGQYFAAVDELGTPVSTVTPGTLQRLPGSVVDYSMLNLFGSAVTIIADNQSVLVGEPCRNVDSTADATLALKLTGTQPLMLQSTGSGTALFYLSFLGPTPTRPVRDIQLQAGVPEWIHLPDAGTAAKWRLRIALGSVGVVRVCGEPSLQLPHTVTYLYRADAANGALDAGWSAVSDPGAIGDHAAKLARGTVPLKRDVFGLPFTTLPEKFDLWYHVRVTRSKGARAAEMTLGLWDDTAASWVGSKTLKANQVATTYSWVKVAAAITPLHGDFVQFMAATAAETQTDWYVDEARLEAASSPPPN